jgi:TonB family protein
MFPEGGDAPQPIVTPHVRYPGGDRARKTETVVVAFIVDTTGRVEYPTVSFLQTARQPLHESVCDVLRAARFSPGQSQGRTQRAVVVVPFSFAVLRDVLEGMPTFDIASYQRALANQPRDSVIAQLERAPHCP